MKRLVILCGALFALTSVAVSVASPTSGVAYDGVTKRQAQFDPTKYDPKTFDEDFRAAAEGSLLTMSSSGQAERHYVTSTKERVDNLVFHKATIIDCDAKTVTTLDLSAKTYFVKTFDASKPPGSPVPDASSSAPATAMGLPDLSKSRFSSVSENKALGPHQFGEIWSDGYQTESTISMSAGGDFAQESKSSATRYYTKTEVPKLACPELRVFSMMMSEFFSQSMLQQLASLVRDAPSPSDNQRFSVKNNGPALPSSRLVLIEVSKNDMQMNGMSLSVSTFTERGHIRPISSDDPVFQVPSDFKRSE